MSIQRIVQMVTREDGSVIYEFCLNGFPVYLYQPAGDMLPNLINYSFTGPTIVVFPDRRLTIPAVEAYSAESGLTEISRQNGMGLIFLNPRGETWTGEEPGAYEALTANLSIPRGDYHDGLIYNRSPVAPDELSYAILGSTIRLYAYAIGTGADYVAANYLRPVGGSASLGDLGRANLSMVCCTLVGGTVLPRPEPNDIHVVSVGHSDEYNAILRQFCLDVVTEEKQDFVRDFHNVVGKYRRWNGQIVPAYLYEAEGIVCKGEELMVPVSDDNPNFARMMRFMPVKEHKIGYVTFYDKDLDLHGKKVPLMLVFHGGGDSALATASIAEWPEIGQREGFITVAVERHMSVSAGETIALLDHLLEEYPIDPGKVYATGFSMGGIKSWDLFEQYPDRFAALLPMDAIDYLGNNCFGGHTDPARINQDVLVPIFYIGGEDSFGVELAYHHERAVQRFAWLAKVNRFRKAYDVSFENKDNWEDQQFGISGDRVEILHDDAFPESVYTLNYFDSDDGRCYTALLGVSHHAHEIRPFTNNTAWNFVKQFRRTDKGIVIE